MKYLFSLFIIFVMLVILPLLIGNIWSEGFDLKLLSERIFFSHLMGFFSLLSIWQLITVPLAIIRVKFSVISGIYAFVLLICCLSVIKYRWRFIRSFQFKNLQFGFTQNKILKRQFYNKSIYTYIYKGLFFCLLFVQIYYALFYSRSFMSDDGYAVYSAMAVTDNYIFQSNPMAGVATYFSSDWIRRVVQSELYFPGFISLLSGIDAASICHTVLYVYVTILAYEASYLLISDLSDTEENKWLGLFLISLISIYGYHSHYSLTFRLLGPNDEGKAILAVVMTPLMLFMILKVLENGYSVIVVRAVMMLSIAGMSLTLGSMYTFIALLCALVILGLIITKDKRILLIGLHGAVFPILYSSLYAFLLFI